MGLKYFRRAVKQFIYFAIIVLIMTLIVFYLSKEGQTTTYLSLFENGSGRKISIFLLLFSLIYPIFGYTKKEIGIKGSLSDNYNAIVSAMRECNFKDSNNNAMDNYLNKNGEEVLIFRHKSGFIRAMRMFEDKITITDKKDGFIEIEGLRKEIVRVANRIEHSLDNSYEERG